MKKIIYSKCATERKKEYRLITTIKEQDKERVVSKKALGELSKAHVNHIHEVYTEHLFRNEKVQLTPCKKEGDGFVTFEYIYGDTFASQFEESVAKEDWVCFIDLIRELKEIIWSVKDKKLFQNSSEFEHYFGNISELETYEAAENLNIDLLPENLIVSGAEKYVIDYEWVLPFLVPIKYVMFRALFFSPFMGKLPGNVRKEVLKIAEISEAEWKLFFKMEVCFQNHVSDSSLDDLFKKMPQNIFVAQSQQIGMFPLRQIIAKDKSGEIQYYEFSDKAQQKVSFTVKEAGEITLELSQVASIIKIQGIYINDVQCTAFKTNSMLEIIDDYYFSDAARVSFEVPAEAKITIDYMFINNEKNELIRLADTLKKENETTLKNMQLEDWHNKDILRISELEQEVASLHEEVNVLNGELTLIKNSKVWRVYSKLRGL